MAAIFALLRGKAALAAKPKFKTYPERFDYEKGFADYCEKNIRPLADCFEKERVKVIKTARRRWFWSLPLLLFFFGHGGLYFFTENELAGAFLILCLLLVLCIILYCFSIGPVMRYEASLKEKIYPIIIKFFGPFDY